MIFYLDKEIIKVLDLVSNSNLAKNTIVIITSDHGEEFMEHGSLVHPADHLYNTLISEGPNDSIRNNRWKSYLNNQQIKRSIEELYDLNNDPQEKNNVAKENPEIVRDLYDNLNRIIYKK